MLLCAGKIRLPSGASYLADLRLPLESFKKLVKILLSLPYTIYHLSCLLFVGLEFSLLDQQKLLETRFPEPN
jgi:hypothetical protein